MQNLIRPDEYLLILSGFFVLISVAIIVFSGSFAFWLIAKMFYGVGVLAHVATH